MSVTDDAIDLGSEENELLERDDESELPPSDIVAYSELRSCADIFRMYEDKLLDLHPEFQREEVWKNTGKTRFIDSLIKQLPIPSLCLAYDYKTENRQVIDGLQRISTIVKFLADEKWTLSRLDDIDPKISGKQNLDFRDEKSELFVFYKRVKNATLPITVLRCDLSNKRHQKYLFTIFHRLNTGGLKLNNQEIRNCIFQGPFNTMVRSLARGPVFRRLLGFDGDDATRFKVEELLVRFFAYSSRFEKYTGRLASFLNDYMSDSLGDSEEVLSDKEAAAKRVAKAIADGLPELLDGRKRSLAIVESVLVGVGRNIENVENKLLADASYARDSLKAMLADAEFSEARLRGGLADSERVRGRMTAAIAAFAR